MSWSFIRFSIANSFCLLILSRFLDLTMISGMALIWWAISVIVALAKGAELVVSVEALLRGFIMTAFSVYLLCEVWPAYTRTVFSTLLIYLVFAGVTAVSLLRTPQGRLLSSPRLALLMAPTLILLWGAVCLLPLASKIRVLGLGYDNYGHMAQSRNIYLHSHSFLLDRSDSITFIATDTPQAAASSVAFLVRLIASDVSPVTYLNVFCFLSLLLPLCFLFLLLPTIRRLAQNWFSIVSSCLLIISVVEGHVGRIWFSGYFASNLATLLTCLIARTWVTDRMPTLRRSVVQIVAVTHLWPPLGLGLLIAYLALALFSLFFGAQRRSGEVQRSVRTRIDVISIGLSASAVLSLYFPYRAISRTFDMEHIRVEGGIAAPSGSMYLLGIVCLSAVGATCVKKTDRFVLLPALSGFSVATVVVMAASYTQNQHLTYYPAKILIGLTSALLVVVSTCRTSVPPSPPSFRRQLVTCLFLCLFLLSQTRLHNDKEIPFPTGYMGRMSKALQSWATGRNEVVDPEAIVAVIQRGAFGSPAILYLSDQYESELNTRWLNSVRSSWTDLKWTAWSNVREQLIAGDFGAADVRIVSSRMMIILTDSFLGFDYKTWLSRLPKSASAGLICRISSDSSIPCAKEN